MKEYQAVIVRVTRHVRDDEDALTDLLNERSRMGWDEVNLGLDPAASLAEARRCFNCGVCNRCEIRLIYCPDLAITRRADGQGFDIQYEYCKGCGLCNAECPRGAMAMTREGL